MKAPPQRRGGVLGATTSIESFTRIIAPLMGGYIMAWRPSSLGWISGAFFTIATLIAIGLFREFTISGTRDISTTEY
jgi:MFS family permease